ncbi:actin-related protein [Cryptosporidium felis]|nr:actin-related protein [Cryptosporidium felis]
MATLHYDDVITSQPTIIDNGSGTIKCGFAGEETPRVIVNSYVGRPKYKRCMAGALEGDIFVGNFMDTLFLGDEDILGGTPRVAD